MQAIILAAGKSSRFYPYNAHLEHKSLVKMMGKTLLEHTLDALTKAGVSNVVLVVGKDSKIPELLSKREGMDFTFVEQPEPLGMGDALLKAKEHVEDRFFLLGAYHMDIVDFAKDMLTVADGGNAVVLVKKDEITSRYGAVELDGEKVVSIVEKPTHSQENNLRLLALYILPKTFIEILQELPTEEYHFEKALDVFAKKGHVRALSTEKPTVTLKYAWDLLGVKEYLLRSISEVAISPTAFVAKDAVISGEVIIEDHASIMEGACIKGPAYIGKGVTIGNRAIVRGGVIVEAQSTIGSQMEIKNAFVMEQSTTHAGFIGDSVVGSQTKIAAGFITANARLDRQHVTTVVRGEKVNTGLRHIGTIIGNNDNIGIRVSTMPGVFIGNHVVVGPSTTVMKNIPDNTKYFTKFQEIVEENSNE